MAFEPGRSGNPQGRPPGRQDRRTQLREALAHHADDIVAKAVEMAKAGDSTAMRLCLDRILPPLKAMDAAIVMDELRGNLADQGAAVLAAVSDGRITPEQAATILGGLSSQARLVEATELERRIAALEAKNGK